MVLEMNYNQVLEHVQVNNIVLAAAGAGVLSGLDVSERAAGTNMSVDVATGSALIGGTTYTESSIVNLTISTADATHARKDLVIYDVATTNPLIVTGTPATPPVPPDITSGDILLAIIDVAANENEITNSEITDCIVEVIKNVFEESSNVLRETSWGGYDNDFVIGSPQLADDGNTAHDDRVWFDKSKGAFRAGKCTGDDWDDANVGTLSFACGSNNEASGLCSFSSGGGCTASAQYSIATGYFSRAEQRWSSACGNSAYAYMNYQRAMSAGAFSAYGDAQCSYTVYRIETTAATQTTMSVNGSAPTIDNRLFIPANRTWAFTVNIAARQTAGTGTIGDSGIYKIEGGIKRDGANNTALIGAITKTVLAEDQSSWDVTAEADDTNECLVVKVTGEAGKTIHWVAKIDLVEVG